MITQPTIKDTEKMLDLWESAVSEAYPWISYERIILGRNMLKHEWHMLPQIRILKSGKGKIAALIRVNKGMIDFLYVYPSERKKGYASMLVHHVLEQMEVKGVVLHNPKQHVIRFYEKIGFRLERNEFGNNRKVHMALEN